MTVAELALELGLERPLAFFDTETTGVNPDHDRIIDLAVTRLMPEGTVNSRFWRMNPTVPIPESASKIHGIYERHIAAAPTFKAMAPDIAAYLDGCDLAGYNVVRFDLRLLVAEMKRAGHPFETDGRRVVDCFRIYQAQEPRDLGAAVRFYTGVELANAHNAAIDVEATIDVLVGQLRRYPNLPRTLAELDEISARRDPSWIDKDGRIVWADGCPRMNFGKHNGVPLRDLTIKNRDYLTWMMKPERGFSPDTIAIIADALRGKFPAMPKAISEPRGDL